MAETQTITRWEIPRRDDGTPTAYPREAVLSLEETAAALGVHTDTVERAGVPSTYIGRRRLYVWGQVLDWLTKRAA